MTEQHSATPADEILDEHAVENPIELHYKSIINAAVEEKIIDL